MIRMNLLSSHVITLLRPSRFNRRVQLVSDRHRVVYHVDIVAYDAEHDVGEGAQEVIVHHKCFQMSSAAPM